TDIRRAARTRAPPPAPPAPHAQRAAPPPSFRSVLDQPRPRVRRAGLYLLPFALAVSQSQDRRHAVRYAAAIPSPRVREPRPRVQVERGNGQPRLDRFFAFQVGRAPTRLQDVPKNPKVYPGFRDRRCQIRIADVVPVL